MICSTFLEEIAGRLNDLNSRVRVQVLPLSDNQLNWTPVAGQWSIGQILDHLRIANSHYLPIMERAIEEARFGSEGAQVRHSLVGSLLIKASGPGGNAPAPKALLPGPGPFTHSEAQAFFADHTCLMELARKADGVDLSQTKVRNPLIPLLRMNVADCFEIIAVHGERHVGQMEELTRRGDFPKN